MNRTLASASAAVIAAVLWLVWNVEHEHTSVRAPWTGLTLAGSLLGFVLAGIVGRGWRAVLSASAAAIAAAVVVEPLAWQLPPPEPELAESCDPGCIPYSAFVAFTAIAAAALSALGIAVRRAVALLRGWMVDFRGL